VPAGEGRTVRKKRKKRKKEKKLNVNKRIKYKIKWRELASGSNGRWQGKSNVVAIKVVFGVGQAPCLEGDLKKGGRIFFLKKKKKHVHGVRDLFIEIKFKDHE
jgi:hypothetical protein